MLAATAHLTWYQCKNLHTTKSPTAAGRSTRAKQIKQCATVPDSNDDESLDSSDICSDESKKTKQSVLRHNGGRTRSTRTFQCCAHVQAVLSFKFGKLGVR